MKLFSFPLLALSIKNFEQILFLRILMTKRTPHPEPDPPSPLRKQ